MRKVDLLSFFMGKTSEEMRRKIHFAVVAFQGQTFLTLLAGNQKVKILMKSSNTYVIKKLNFLINIVMHPNPIHIYCMCNAGNNLQIIM